jgi:hypothetical protein
MQMSEAAELRKQWSGKPCKHPHVVSEYALGKRTGDYVCTTCGEVGWGKNWPEEELEAKQNK